MGLDAKKFNKLRLKVENRLIGDYGSSKGLGQDLIVKRYSYTTNSYGDSTLTYVSQETCKGIVVTSSDYELGEIPNLKVREGEIRLYIPIGVEVEDTETTHYEFEFSGKTYLLVYKNNIGQVCNISGVVREITLKPKPQ